MGQEMGSPERLDDLLQRLATERQKSLSQIMGSAARMLVGTPYVAWTLERDLNHEVCYATLDGLDCVTFAEAVWNLARATQSGKPYLSLVQDSRYRNGALEGYLSRLHYTSDWFGDNIRRGRLVALTPNLPGVVRSAKTFNFMSANAKFYRQLEANPAWIPELKTIEKRLSQQPFWMVPTEKAATAQMQLQTGDIIGIVDKRPGMDCSHVGLIVREGERVRFCHASSTAKKVVLDQTLAGYLKRNSAPGFIAVRPVDRR